MRAKLITLASALLWAAAVLPFSARANDLLLKSNSASTTAPTAASLLLENGRINEGPAALESAGVEPVRASNLFIDYEQQSEAAYSEEIARSLPSSGAIQQIQEELRNLNVPAAARRTRTRRAYPGIAISNPTGYGAHRGQVFAGVGYQSRTRFSGRANTGQIFGGGKDDSTVGLGFGVGDADRGVGVQVSYIAASFGGSRAPLSGGLNAKIHKRFDNGWSAAIGGEGIINFGRLPPNGASGNGVVEYNDFEGTYYGAVSKVVSLREDYSKPFSRLIITGGAGSGRFRSVDKIVTGEFGVGVFGTAALQVLPSTTLITEWTGQDLAVGLSIAPFSNVPIVLTPAIRDIVGESDGDPRFVLGVGVSLSEAFSLLGF